MKYRLIYELPEDIRYIAWKHHNDDYIRDGNTFRSSFEEFLKACLISTFNWSKSPEGDLYWRQMNFSIVVHLETYSIF